MDIWKEYGRWLLWRVGFQKKGFKKLMETLHSIKFTWIIDFDENRAADGMMYRYYFLDDFIKHHSSFTREYVTSFFENRECSVLEMFVGFAIRVDLEYIGDPANPRPDLFLWEMIQNLGLDSERDSGFNRDFVKSTCEKWMDRDFDDDGNHSIFPLKRALNDQRQREIWSQMTEYISENYGYL